MSKTNLLSTRRRLRVLLGFPSAQALFFRLSGAIYYSGFLRLSGSRCPPDLLEEHYGTPTPGRYQPARPNQRVFH
jgi:hypothetical protein